MAIVEDEVRNDSSEENDIEVVVEEYDAEQDSDDSDVCMRAKYIRFFLHFIDLLQTCFDWENCYLRYRYHYKSLNS